MFGKNFCSLQKRLAIFIHGFGSSSKCWDDLFELLKNDPTVTNEIDLVRFEYPTKWFNALIFQRIPRLMEVADVLAEFIKRLPTIYTDITLLGHSQGGLIIQTYLTKMLQEAHGEELDRIRQVVLIATPNLGSTRLGPGRNIFFRVFKNPQERALRVLNEEIHDVLRVISERVTNATQRDKIQWPIPMRCFWGLQDRIVLEASARGPYSEGSGLLGDHFTILNPTSRADQRYQAFCNALIKPIGHKNFHEVDLFEQAIQVEPLPQSFEEKVTFGSNNEKQRLIYCDNLARVVRKVSFSCGNRCSNKYVLAYRTRNQGFIRARASHSNEADPQEFGRYYEYGTEYTFKFTPKPGEQYKLELDVYKGFDMGKRDIHFHLNRQTHYRRCRVRLDLSPYLKAGFMVSTRPELRFYPQDSATCDSLQDLPSIGPLQYSNSETEGVWEWELFDLWQGGISVKWDVLDASKEDGRALVGTS